MLSEGTTLKTTYISLWIQGIAGLIVIYGLLFLNNLDPKDKVLHDILLLEGSVQLIEFVFYLYIVQNYYLQTMARDRYYDWVITTPTMLFTLMLYFYYEISITSGKVVTINTFLSQYKLSIIFVLFCNLLMLLFGYLGEVGILDLNIATALGFIAFAFAFGEIYYRFARHLPSNIRALFYIVFVIWALYGIAFLFPVDMKNTVYNGLDIIAKNMFGVYLVAKLLQVQRKS